MDSTDVAPWVQELTEQVIGASPVRVGGRYLHPDDGPIEIVSGQFWGTYGLSNHWSWRVLATNDLHHGYGYPWPAITESDKTLT